ncbi:MAG: shikimate dehydrogenase [Chloroflexota bacterium]|nr:shikimate dehydrogenase [Chloroflexota bacterium]
MEAQAVSSPAPGEQEAEQATRFIGLFGYPVEHSLSPAMQNAAFAAAGLPYRYVLLPTPPGDFESQVGHCLADGFAGWNVTVPHKERMVSLLDEVSDEVLVIGACNTVRVEGGQLLGFNTDPRGFMRGLTEAGGIEKGSRVVLLGAGGAARSVAWALSREGHSVLILSRDPEQAEQVVRSLVTRTHRNIEPGSFHSFSLTNALKEAAMLVNCTPVGQWPHTNESPLPYNVRLPEHLLVYDLVYRPRPTRLLRDAQIAGCRTQDGLAMLVNQGAASFRIWTGQEAPLEVMWEAVRAET